MRKIFQTVVSKTSGNCMQAACASLLNLKLNEVPNFIDKPETATGDLCDFISKYGFTAMYYDKEEPDSIYPSLKEVAHYDGGVLGYFYAVVLSQTYDDGSTHAVIVDKDLNIVHDPNPNQLALKLKPDDVIQIMTVRGDWHLDMDGNFVTTKK